MKLWDLLEKERGILISDLHLDPLEERTWECDRLVVIDEEDVVFYDGPANVEVNPHVDGTADLVADKVIKDWRPNLIAAQVWCVDNNSSYLTGWLGTVSGLYCRGLDKHGKKFTWVINGPPVNYCRRRRGITEKVAQQESD